VLYKDPFLALVLWYSKKVGVALEKDESVLIGKQSRNKGATDELPRDGVAHLSEIGNGVKL
jgi:hypothetical protein